MPKVKFLIRAIRAFAFSASLIPVLVAGALALSSPVPPAWGVYPLVILAALCLHAGTNVISEYYDFKKGVDQPHTFGSSRVLVDGLLSPATVLAEGRILLLAALLLGLVLVYVRGIAMLVLGLAGLAGGYFYSAGPVGYKYRGWGDLMVFLLMGPLMVVGAYFALTGNFTARALLVSLPVGFLVTAILSSNNLRDIGNDTAAGVLTTESIIGHRPAQGLYLGLLAAAYASVILMVAAKVLPVWSLLTLVSLPAAARNARLVIMNSPARPQGIAGVDVATAQLHMIFGLLLTLSLVIAHLAA